MLVDGQIHVWRALPDYPNPAVTITSPATDIPLELYQQYMGEYNIDRAVLVQPMYLGDDNAYIANCAAQDPAKFKSVCVVDPRRTDAPEQLEYWVGQRGCAGLRLRPRNEPEAACFGDPSTYRLWQAAQARRVVISILIHPSQLLTLSSLATRFPRVPIILDHMAHPNVTAGVHSADFKNLLALSRQMNIFIKVSGQYYFSNQAYPYEDCADLFRAIYDVFGAERLIWASDFPHVLLKAGFQRSLRLLERVYAYLSSKDLEFMMGLNASALYWTKIY